MISGSMQQRIGIKQLDKSKLRSVCYVKLALKAFDTASANKQKVSGIRATQLEKLEKEGGGSVFTFSFIYIYFFLLSFVRSLMERDRVVG